MHKLPFMAKKKKKKRRKKTPLQQLSPGHKVPYFDADDKMRLSWFTQTCLFYDPRKQFYCLHIIVVLVGVAAAVLVAFVLF